MAERHWVHLSTDTMWECLCGERFPNAELALEHVKRIQEGEHY